MAYLLLAYLAELASKPLNVNRTSGASKLCVGFMDSVQQGEGLEVQETCM